MITLEEIEEWRTKMHAKIHADFCGLPNEAHWLVVRDGFERLCNAARRGVELDHELQSAFEDAVTRAERAENALAAIIEKNAPEIEKINKYLNEMQAALGEAVAREREAR